MLNKAETILEVIDKIRDVTIPDSEWDYNRWKKDAIGIIISALDIWRQDVEKKERAENKKRIEEAANATAEKEKAEEKKDTPSIQSPREKVEKTEKATEDTVDTLIAEYLKMYPARQEDVDEWSDHFSLWMQRRLSPWNE